MFTLIGIVSFFIILLIIQLSFIYLLPILLSSKIFKLNLNKKQIFKFSLLNLFFPLSIFFLGKPYKFLKEKSKIKGVLGFIIIILILVLISFGFKYIYKVIVYEKIFSIYQISDEDGSMYPKYYDKEFVIIDRIFNKYKRGDTIIYNSEEDWDIIKTIIAVEGDTIKFMEGNLFLKKKGEKKFNKINIKKDYSPYLIKKFEVTITKNNFFILSNKTLIDFISYSDNNINDCLTEFNINNENCKNNYINKDKINGKIFFDFGYFNRKKLAFTHPDILEKGEYLKTYPKFFDIK